MTRKLDDLIVSLFRSPTDDSVYAEAQSRRDEIVAYLRRPEALHLLSRLPEEASRQLSLVFTLLVGSPDPRTADDIMLQEERYKVEASLCDAFDRVLLGNLPDDLRNLRRRLHESGAARIDAADLEYLLGEPVLSKALESQPIWSGWEKWGVTPLSLHGAMQAISVQAQKRSDFANVRLLASDIASGDNDITREEAIRAITRATDWSSGVARIVYDWLLEVADHVPRLFEHFEATRRSDGAVVLQPLASDEAMRRDPERFAKRWRRAERQRGLIEEPALYIQVEPSFHSSARIRPSTPRHSVPQPRTAAPARHASRLFILISRNKLAGAVVTFLMLFTVGFGVHLFRGAGPPTSSGAIVAIDSTGSRVELPFDDQEELKQVLASLKEHSQNVVEISMPAEVKTLNLEGTDIADLGSIKNPESLRGLNLGRTPFYDLTQLKHFSSLQWLDLRETKIVDFRPLSDLTHIEVLDLEGTQINDLSPLSKLHNLKNLNLSDTDISDINALGGLASIQYLNLRSTNVQDLGPLHSMMDLKTLDLSNTPVDRRQIEMLRERLANLGNTSVEIRA